MRGGGAVLWENCLTLVIKKLLDILLARSVRGGGGHTVCCCNKSLKFNSPVGMEFFLHICFYPILFILPSNTFSANKTVGSLTYQWLGGGESRGVYGIRDQSITRHMKENGLCGAFFLHVLTENIKNKCWKSYFKSDDVFIYYYHQLAPYTHSLCCRQALWLLLGWLCVILSHFVGLWWNENGFPSF